MIRMGSEGDNGKKKPKIALKIKLNRFFTAAGQRLEGAWPTILSTLLSYSFRRLAAISCVYKFIEGKYLQRLHYICRLCSLSLYIVACRQLRTKSTAFSGLEMAFKVCILLFIPSSPSSSTPWHRVLLVRTAISSIKSPSPLFPP